MQAIRNILYIVHIFLLLNTVESKTSITTDFYTAGVVEFEPRVFGANSSVLLEENLLNYLNLINSIEANETDIIIFPEGTLNSLLQASVVPDPKSYEIICSYSNGYDYYESFLKKISCAARDTKKYIVININEREKCNVSCNGSEWNIFNTNVVFNREGRVISRYRKWHVYLEPGVSIPKSPEYSIFETDFGVRFGHFICFDILFYTPAQELVTKYGVHDIIFTSFFYSELPFLTATQLQQSWAWGNDVNFLAAGASIPEVGATGSGIFAGANGALVQKMSTKNGTRELLIARVPKNPNLSIKSNNPSMSKLLKDEMGQENVSSHISGIELMKDPQLSNFTSELLNITKNIAYKITRRICQLEHCCLFEIATKPIDFNSSPSTFYQYRIGVFNGQRSYMKEEYSNLRICALYACTNENITSCGEIFDRDKVTITSNFIFTILKITGEFMGDENALIMPNTLDTELYSLNSDSVQWSLNKTRSSYEARIELLASRNNILTFSIYANYYDNSAAGYGESSPMVIGFGFILLHVFVNNIK